MYSYCDHPVDERIEKIAESLEDFESKNPNDIFPGLSKTLRGYLQNSSEDPKHDNVDREKFIRSLLRVFWKSKDGTYSEVLSKYSEDEAKVLRKFVEQKASPADLEDEFRPGVSPPSREELHMTAQASVTDVTHHLEDHKEGILDKISDGLHRIEEHLEAKLHLSAAPRDLPQIKSYDNAEFFNWGKTVKNVPRYTFEPKTVQDVQAIVSFAKQKNLPVRCAGYRHSWSDSFSGNGEILIAFVSKDDASRIPNFVSLPVPQMKPTELQDIREVPSNTFYDVPKNKRLVRIGTGVTNERFRRWCVQNNAISIPFNSILVEVTFGGGIVPICHGSGRRHKTLSDLVRKIEYIDINGKLQEITAKDPEFLKAASGSFGLIGVVTHMTLECDVMTYAEMRPRKIPAMLAVPPPKGFKVPGALKKNFTEKQLADAQADFERRANDDYYAEWFWFPYSDYCWVNTWNNTTDKSNVKDYPSKGRIVLQWASTLLGNIFQNLTLVNELVKIVNMSESVVTILSRAAMAGLPEVMPNEDPIKTYLIDALHFQRGIQNIRVLDMEVEMPLQPKKSDPGKVDYRTVQEAWWKAIAKCYENNIKCPQRMPLEMRIMGGSDVTMAPQFGNKLGTCAIEVLTLHSCIDIWPAYAQSVLDEWMNLRDDNGRKLLTRPHWAKEWSKFQVDGQNWVDRVRNEECRDQIAAFKRTLAEIGKRQGWKVEEIQKRFSNPLFNRLIYAEPAPRAAAAVEKVKAAPGARVQVTPVADEL